MTSVDDLGAVLAANGLGAFAATFAAEQITLETAAELNESDMKELGIPMGPRKKVLLMMKALAAPKLQRPDVPAASHAHDSPRHKALLQASGDTPADALMNSGKKYGCFLSHHKASCAMEGEAE
jgi:hypothetical protein